MKVNQDEKEVLQKETQDLQKHYEKLITEH